MNNEFNRARRGKEFLAAIDPDFKSKIDLWSLDLGSTEFCVLGQLFGSYEQGLEELDIDQLKAEELGFDGVITSAPGKREVSYSFLTQAWKEVLIND